MSLLPGSPSHPLPNPGWVSAYFPGPSIPATSPRRTLVPWWGALLFLLCLGAPFHPGLGAPGGMNESGPTPVPSSEPATVGAQEAWVQ